MTFSITPDDIPVPARCPLLDIPLAMQWGRSGDNSATLDRINPALGYEPGNVWVISNRANQIKSNATPEELLRIGRGLRARLKGA